MTEIYKSHWENATKNILSDIPELDQLTYYEFLKAYCIYNGILNKGYGEVNDLINYMTYLHVIVRDYMEGKIKFDAEKQVFYIIKRVDLFSNVEQIVH